MVEHDKSLDIQELHRNCTNIHHGWILWFESIMLPLILRKLLENLFTINHLSFGSNINLSEFEINCEFVLGQAQWLLPKYTNHTPEAFLLTTDETEAAEVILTHIHFLKVKLILVGMQELIGWSPFSIGASVLPHVLVVLMVFLDSCSVIVKSIIKGTS